MTESGIHAREFVENPKRRFGSTAIMLTVLIVTCILFVFLADYDRFVWTIQRHTRRNFQCLNNIRNTGIATVNFASQSDGRLPFGCNRDENGDRLHSWRTSLLPMLENAALSRQINWEEPWNSPANLEFVGYPIRVFRCPDDTRVQLNETSFFSVTGPGTLSPAKGQVTINDVASADGTATTLMIVEATEMQTPWMMPRDIPFELVTASPRHMKGYGPSSCHEAGLNVFFVDGYGGAISHDIDPQVLRALITWNGGEEIPDQF